MSADSLTSSGQPGETPRLKLAAMLLDSGIQARRAGKLGDLVRHRTLATRWLLRRYTDVLRDGLETSDVGDCAELMLDWLVVQLRPDGQPHLHGIQQECWLQRSGWRPFLAIASLLTLIPVPDFPRRYRRRPEEAPLDNLCGLWDVGPSTVYRWLERSRLAMARAALEPADAARRLSLRAYVSAHVTANLDLAAQGARARWHQARAEAALAVHDPMSALWHSWQASDLGGAVAVVRAHAPRLAAMPEVDAVVAGIAALQGTSRERFDFCLALAAIEQARSRSENELHAYEQALQIARQSQEKLLLGIAYSSLGKFHETRDADRAFACYQDSAAYLLGLDAEGQDVHSLDAFVTAHVRLAWLYLQRNDPRSEALLERADALHRRFQLADPLVGIIEQAWSLYWRRKGEVDRSLEHAQRALNIFERIGDLRSELATCQNIAWTHAERRDFPRAIAYAGRVLAAARVEKVDAEVVGNTFGTLGSVYFWMGDFDRAIEHYNQALSHIQAAGLSRLSFRVQFNLAEAHFARFRERGNVADEAWGDAFVEELVRAPAAQASPEILDAVTRLKSTTLQAGTADAPNRLMLAEEAVHFDEM